nr:hypothetical protein [Streptomyces palmae]
MVTATAAALALAVGAMDAAQASPGAAQAGRSAELPRFALSDGPAGGLPSGWQITGTGAGRQLVWQAPHRVPMGDARVEFYAGDRLLGRPVAAQDQRTFRLRLGAADPGSASGLRVLAGGRRLDTAGSDSAGNRVRPAVPPRPADPLPANPVDPGTPGRYRTAGGEYTLKSVRLPGFAEPVEMRATVLGPTNAPGRRPLALFLHGRHFTCFNAGGDITGDWPCASGMRPVPSYRGYLRDQKLLASQGYVTVSISANGINGQDGDLEDGGAQARSSLVRLHLARWAGWSADRTKAPAAVRAISPADLSRTLLVGHSRGGEGVDRAALDSLAPPPADQDGYRGPVRWRIRGTALIGPTAFGQNPAPDVPSMTILPGCDGDVSDLQGQMYVDGTRGISRGAALHSAVYIPGANHNFFNSEWTPGQAKAPAEDDFATDDKPDPVCSPGARTRLSATAQHTAGATYIAAAARLFVGGDDRVRPLLDGSGRRAPSADPARVLTHAVGGRRTAAFLPDASTAVAGGRLCAQVSEDRATACLPPDSPAASPHFATWEMWSEPGRYAAAMRWSRAGSAMRVRPARPVSLAGAKDLSLRVIVPPNSKGTRLDVALADASGRRAVLGQAALDGLPGTERTASYWGREVRVPLTAATGAGLDLKHVKSLELIPRSRSGQAWLMDAWGWRPGTPVVRPASLPRVDLGRLTVKEGDSGVRTYRMPVRVSGRGSGQVRLFVSEPDTGQVDSRLVTVRPGGRDIEVSFPVRGDTRFGWDEPHDVFVKAVRGAVIGSYRGGVTAVNDDPMPTVTVRPVDDHVTEGRNLTWRVSLSAVADVDVSPWFVVRPVSGGTELSTRDVDPRWLEDAFGASPSPDRPLSQVVHEPILDLTVPAGQQSIEASVPTVADKIAEPEESLRLRLFTYDEAWEPKEGPEFTGTVRDAG